MEWIVRNHWAALAYNASDSTLTRRVLKELESLGQLGRIAAALFRAQKASTRAKQYRGGTAYGRSYTDLAYGRKEHSLRSLCDLLSQDAAGLTWGWGEDSKQDFARQVLYVDLPAGQVSFHSRDRHNGPDYACEWDGVSGVSQVRILQLCDGLLRNARRYRSRVLGGELHRGIPARALRLPRRGRPEPDVNSRSVFR